MGDLSGGVRRVSPLLFRQHLSLRLLKACTHEVGRSIRDHTTSYLRNHRFNMARYRFYTRAKTLALCPLGIRGFAVEGLSSAFLLKKTGSRPSSLPYNTVYSFTIYILVKRTHIYLSKTESKPRKKVKNRGWGKFTSFTAG